MTNDCIKDKITIIEDDYINREELKITSDVYNLTIGVNMTKAIPPTQILFCVKQCFMVFIIQITISILFFYERREFNAVQPFNKYHTTLRIIVPVLMATSLGKDLNQAIKMFTFLKRSKGSANNSKGRFINMMLASCQIIGPFLL